MATYLFGNILSQLIVLGRSRYEGQRPLSDYESNVTRYSNYLQDLNRGFMQSLQANPNDTTTDCYVTTTTTNTEIAYMMDGANYSTGVIN